MRGGDWLAPQRRNCASRAGQRNVERGAAFRTAAGPDFPAVLFDDAVGNAQAEPGALADGLGSKEGIGDLF